PEPHPINAGLCNGIAEAAFSGLRRFGVAGPGLNRCAEDERQQQADKRAKTEYEGRHGAHGWKAPFGRKSATSLRAIRFITFSRCPLSTGWTSRSTRAASAYPMRSGPPQLSSNRRSLGSALKPSSSIS